MLNGDNGLLKRAGDARDETIVGQEKEQVELAYVSAAVKKLGDNVDKDDLQNELDASVGENKTIVTGSGTLKVKFEDTKNEYTVSQNGNVAKYEVVEPTDVYATVCTNGTLIFSSNEADIEAYLTTNNTQVATGYEIEDITNKSYYFDEDEDEFDVPPWFNVENAYADLNIVKINFLNTIAPKNTACWMYGLENLTTIENIGNLNTSNVTNMSCMFCGCHNLTNLDLSNFDTSKVTDMSGMFDTVGVTNLDLRGFDTRNVTNMSGMFGGSDVLTKLDLSNFDTSKVTDMSNMFASCFNLTTIYVSDNFITTNVENSTYMFVQCDSLRGGNNTTYNSSHVDKTYARIDTASTPGYFTAK